MSQWESRGTRKLNNHYQSVSSGTRYRQGAWLWYNYNYFGNKAKIYFEGFPPPPPPSIDTNASPVGTSLIDGAESIFELIYKSNAWVFSPVCITFYENLGWPYDRQGNPNTLNYNNSLTNANNISFLVSDQYHNDPGQIYVHYNSLRKFLRNSRFNYNGQVKTLFECLYFEYFRFPNSTLVQFDDLKTYVYNPYATSYYYFLYEPDPVSGTMTRKVFGTQIDDNTYILFDRTVSDVSINKCQIVF